MKRKSVFLVPILAAVLGFVFIAKPTDSPMTIIREDISYGYEGNPTDGCLGPDETLRWLVRGDLAAGEFYSYTYQLHCDARDILVSAMVDKGRPTDLQLTIRAFYTGEWHEVSALISTCLYWYQSGEMYQPWEVIVKNVDSHAAKNIHFQGTNRMQIGLTGCVGF